MGLYPPFCTYSILRIRIRIWRWLVNALWYVYQKSDKDEFSKKYIEMLSSGGTKSHNDLLRPFNLSAYEDSFWDKGISMITSLMDELEALQN